MTPKWHYVWFDGCASQFKSSKPWYFDSRYLNMTGGCKMMWSYFRSGQGKGPHDGVGEIIKCFIQCEQLNTHGKKLQNVEEVVNFLHANLSRRLESSNIGGKKPLCRVFWHVKYDDCDHHLFSFACDTIESTVKIHYICVTNKHVLT
jgi:hypothetical protein